MKNYPGGILAVTAGLLIFFLSPGCATKSTQLPFRLPSVHQAAPVSTQSIPLPERIHKQPAVNDYGASRVAVFRFTDALNQKDVGYTAADKLYRIITQFNSFADVRSELAVAGTDVKDQLTMARQKKYDLIITGRVLHYLDATQYQASRADIEVKVYSAETSELIWWATSSETAFPIPQIDYFVYKTRGEMGLPTSTLLENAAAKFANMFAWSPPRTNTLTEDMKLIDQGYNLLIAREYEAAASSFRNSLAINPDNPYAFLNLGVVLEEQGDITGAAEMYRKVIVLNPSQIVKESNKLGVVGRTLTDIAKTNLDALDL